LTNLRTGSGRKDVPERQAGNAPRSNPDLGGTWRVHRDRVEEALAELVAEQPTDEKSAMLDEVLTADRLLTTLSALIPFVGPWLIHRSEVHKPGQKRTLSWISIGLTGLWLLALLWRLPSPSNQYARLREGIESQIQWLPRLAEQYRFGTIEHDAVQRGTGHVLPPDEGPSKK
jgi:hypothetical protein